MFLPATAVMSLMGLIRGGPGDTGERRGDGGSEQRKRGERDRDRAVDGVREVRAEAVSSRRNGR